MNDPTALEVLRARAQRTSEKLAELDYWLSTVTLTGQARPEIIRSFLREILTSATRTRSAMLAVGRAVGELAIALEAIGDGLGGPASPSGLVELAGDLRIRPAPRGAAGDFLRAIAEGLEEVEQK